MRGLRLKTRGPFRLDLTVFLITGILAAAAMLTVMDVAWTQDVVLESKFHEGALPLMDPEAEVWRRTPAMLIPLAWQNLTKPMLLSPSIRTLTVRSINNGTWIAFLIEWKDSTPNLRTFRTEQFRDAVAIMFPIKNQSTPPFLGMGEPDKPVNIWHWKADWQEDIDKLFQDLEKAYPNIWVNYYPFAIPAPPYIIPPLANHSKTFISGWAAGNPLSDPVKITPVEDLIAAGFGTLTSQHHQDVIGKGMWREGTWKVIMGRPMTSVDRSDTQFQPGIPKHVAFAVWEGSNNEVDGRKSFSNWHVLKIETGIALVTMPIWTWLVIATIWLMSIVFLLMVSGGFPRRRKK